LQDVGQVCFTKLDNK